MVLIIAAISEIVDGSPIELFQFSLDEHLAHYQYYCTVTAVKNDHPIAANKLPTTSDKQCLMKCAHFV